MKIAFFLICLFPFTSWGDETSLFFYEVSSKSKKIQPEYEICKEVDLSSLELEEISPSSEDITAKFCFSCSLKEAFGFGELKETTQAIQSKTFMDKLRKRVIGQIESKIFQTKVLRACATGDRNWLSRQKVDWPLMKALCKQKNKQLKSSIQTRWREMRVNLALTQVNPDQIATGNPHLSFPLSHAISDFSPIPKLTKKEQRIVKKRWADRLAKTPLDKLTSGEFKASFLKGKPSKLSTGDRRKLRKSTWKMQKEAKDAYFEITSEMPLLGYLETGNPDKKELSKAFKKMEENLKDLLKEAKDSEGDKGLLLFFKPLVEELLSEDKDYCLVAEKARIKAEKDESLKNWMMLGAGVVAAVPCFITGPVGASVCLTAGVALGVVGYKEAQSATKKSLGRALTGKQFETMAGLSKKEKEELLAKLFLPLGAWGTTAGPARAAGKTIAKALNKDAKESDFLIQPKSIQNKATEKNSNPNLSKEAEEAQRRIEEAKRRTEEAKRRNRDSIQETLSAFSKLAAKSISPIPATKINIKLLPNATEAEAKELILKLKKETDDLPDIKFRDEDQDLFMAADEIEHPRNYLQVMDGIGFAYNKLQYVIKRSNGARLYHGSKSSSLLIFAENNPLEGLKGFKQKGVSTVNITDFDIALAYAKGLSSAKPFIKQRLSLSEVSKAANELIEEDFPVIYGIKPKQDKKINPHLPDIPILMGESQGAGIDVLLEGNVSPQEISSVFVPAHKVKSVENMIKALNLSHTITVSPIEPIEEAFK